MKTEIIDGQVFKVIKLKVSHGSASNKWVNGIKGGSSRVRTHGGAAGSRGTSVTTRNSALADVRS